MTKVKSDSKVLMGKKILGEGEFKDRVGGVFSANIRDDLSVQIYDFSGADEAEALGLVLEFSPAFEEEAQCYVFRTDRQAIQELVDFLYDLIKYQKSESE